MSQYLACALALHPGRTYLTYEELCADYESGALHPADLKPALAKHINTILQPVSCMPCSRALVCAPVVCNRSGRPSVAVPSCSRFAVSVAAGAVLVLR